MSRCGLVGEAERVGIQRRSIIDVEKLSAENGQIIVARPSKDCNVKVKATLTRSKKGTEMESLVGLLVNSSQVIEMLGSSDS